jgi:type II secretory pathway pseudopilin PulG
MNKQLTVAIIIGSLLIAGGIIISQSMKQSSIERQQQAELLAEEQKAEKEDRAENLRKLELSICLDTAEEDYWDYMEINGEEREDGTIWALNSFWDRAEKNKQTAINNCYKQFK